MQPISPTGKPVLGPAPCHGCYRFMLWYFTGIGWLRRVGAVYVHHDCKGDNS